MAFCERCPPEDAPRSYALARRAWRPRATRSRRAWGPPCGMTRARPAAVRVTAAVRPAPTGIHAPAGHAERPRGGRPARVRPIGRYRLPAQRERRHAGNSGRGGFRDAEVERSSIPSLARRPRVGWSLRGGPYAKDFEKARHYRSPGPIPARDAMAWGKVAYFGLRTTARTRTTLPVDDSRSVPGGSHQRPGALVWAHDLPGWSGLDAGGNVKTSDAPTPSWR